MREPPARALAAPFPTRVCPAAGTRHRRGRSFGAEGDSPGRAAGADWALAKDWSLGLGLRYLWMESDYEMKTSRLGVFDKGVFQADNLQVLLGITYWFGL